MYVESHAHIDGEEYDGDRDEVVERAREAGVRAILNVGTGDPHSGSYERAVARLAELVRSSSRIIAWGEIGLDYHYDHSPREVQREVFVKQLRLARSFGLPVIIHSREADEDTVRILRAEWGEEALQGGIMHCFGGGTEMALGVLALGFMISFAGNVTFKKAENLRDVARSVPPDRLLIETDCPYLAPVPYRGRRNEPARVVEVARCLAELHGVDVAEMGRITTSNFMRFFHLEAEER